MIRRGALLALLVALPSFSACIDDPDVDVVGSISDTCSERQYLESLELLHWANQRQRYQPEDYDYMAEGIRQCITREEFRAIDEIYESIPDNVWDDLRISSLCDVTERAGILRIVEPVAAVLDTLGERWDCSWFHESVAQRAAICDDLGLSAQNCEVQAGTIMLFGFNPNAGIKMTMSFAGGSGGRFWREAGTYGAAFLRRNWFKLSRTVVTKYNGPISSGAKGLQSRLPFDLSDIAKSLASHEAAGADLSNGAVEVVLQSPQGDTYQIFPTNELLLDGGFTTYDFDQIRIERGFELRP